MKIIKAVLVIVFVVCSSCRMQFHESLARINNLERKLEYEKALALVESSFKKFPDFNFELIKEQIYINEKLGRYKENLEIISMAHAKGYFFLIHSSIPKFKPYLELDEFEAISQRDLELRRIANDTSSVKYVFLKPDRFIERKEYPVIFIYHGGGSNIIKAKDKWNSQFLQDNYIRVFLQSSRRSDYNSFGWRNSDSLAANVFLTALTELESQFNIDKDSIILGGISAGATAALYTAFTSKINIDRVIAICTGIPEMLMEDDYIRNKEVEVVIIGGENDYYRPRQERLSDSLKKYNIKYKYKILPGMGHDYPPDFHKLLNQLLCDSYN